MGWWDKVRNMTLQGSTGSRNLQGRYDNYEDDYDDYDGYDDYEGEALRDTVRPVRSMHSQPEYTTPSASTREVNTDGRSTVLSIHTNVQMQVVISYPESVEEAGMICDYVKGNKTVVVNLENVQHEMSQRIVDFLCGASYALEGDIQNVSKKIFLIAPKNVDISGHFKEELKANGVLFNSFKQPQR